MKSESQPRITETNKILFMPRCAASLFEMTPIIERVRASRFQPVIFAYRPGSIDDSRLDGLVEQGIEVITPLSDSTKPAGTGYLKKHFKTQYASKFLSTYVKPSGFGQFLSELLRFAEMRRIAKGFLTNEQVKSLVLIGDRHVGWETAFVKASRGLGVGSLIVPFALSDPDSVMVRVKRRDFGPKTKIGRSFDGLAKKVFPLWFHSKHGETLCYLPMYQALAARLAGVMPKNPWSQAGGGATRVTVENQLTKTKLIKQCVAEDKIVVTGKPSTDAIYVYKHDHRRIAGLKAELGINQRDTVIVFALPQYGEDGSMDMNEHLRLMDRLIGIMVSAQPGAKLVVSLHPKCSLATYERILKNHGAQYPAIQVYGLISICDLYVAGASSTITTAILFGKKVVAFDPFDQGESLFDGAPRVATAKTPDIFKQCIESALRRDSEVADKQATQTWGILDGKCTDRVFHELQKLTTPS